MASWAQGSPADNGAAFLAACGKELARREEPFRLAFLEGIACAQVHNACVAAVNPSAAADAVGRIHETAYKILGDLGNHRRRGQQQPPAQPPAVGTLPLLDRCVENLQAAAAAAAGGGAAAAADLPGGGAAGAAGPQHFDVPEALEAYFDAIARISDDDFSDGSCEAALAALWPPDGSAAARWTQVSVFDSMPAMVLQEIDRMFSRQGVTEKLLTDKRRIAGRNGAARPLPNSSPLARFEDNTHAVPFGAAPGAPPATDSLGASEEPQVRRSNAAANRGRAAAGRGDAAQPAHDWLTGGCCDLRVVDEQSSAVKLHVDGAVVAGSIASGYKNRDPGLMSINLQGDKRETIDTGFYEHVDCVAADTGNALIWAAADDGNRIKAFRVAGVQPLHNSAGCNDPDVPQNKMELQYTLRSGGDAAKGGHAGLHVIGTEVLCIKKSGALLTWQLAGLAPQMEKRHPELWDDYEWEEEGSEAEYVGDTSWREIECDDVLESTKGINPHSTYRLQPPPETSAISRNSYEGQFSLTCLLPPPGGVGSAASGLAGGSRLAVAMDSGAIVVYDLTTQRAERLLCGHFYAITEIAAAPAAWATPHLFATAARSGDVKLWDLRASGAAAALTLVLGSRTESVEGLALAAGPTDSTIGGGSMVCFAGGDGEGICAFDLRGGAGRPLYELSTGNQVVSSLAWSDTTKTLVAACDLPPGYECYRDSHKAVIRRPNGTYVFASMASDRESDRGTDSIDEDCELRWPSDAKHQPGDFGAFYTNDYPSLMAYRFSPDAKGEVPEDEWGQRMGARGGGGRRRGWDEDEEEDEEEEEESDDSDA